MSNERYDLSKMTAAQKQPLKKIKEAYTNDVWINSSFDSDVNIFKGKYSDWEAKLNSSDSQYKAFDEFNKVGLKNVFDVISNGDGVIDDNDIKAFNDLNNKGNVTQEDFISLINIAVASAVEEATTTTPATTTTTDNTANQKAIDDAVAKQKAIDDAAKQKAIDEAVAKQKAIDDAAKQKAIDDAVAKQKATDDAAKQKAIDDAAKKQKELDAAAAKQKTPETTTKTELKPANAQVTVKKGDTLSGIINSNYGGNIKYGTEEYWKIANAVMKDNPTIYDPKKNSGRKIVGGSKIDSTVIFPGDKIKLPKVEIEKKAAASKPKTAAGTGTGTGSGTGTTGTKGKLTDSKSDAYVKTNTGATDVQVVKDKNGTITGKVYSNSTGQVATSTVKNVPHTGGTQTDEVVTKDGKMYKISSYVPDGHNTTPEPAHTDTIELKAMSTTGSDKEIKGLYSNAARYSEDGGYKTYYDANGEKIGGSTVKNVVVNQYNPHIEMTTETISVGDKTYEIVTTNSNGTISTIRKDKASTPAAVASTGSGSESKTDTAKETTLANSSMTKDDLIKFLHIEKNSKGDYVCNGNAKEKELFKDYQKIFPNESYMTTTDFNKQVTDYMAKIDNYKKTVASLETMMKDPDFSAWCKKYNYNPIDGYENNYETLDSINDQKKFCTDFEKAKDSFATVAEKFDDFTFTTSAQNNNAKEIKKISEEIADYRKRIADSNDGLYGNFQLHAMENQQELTDLVSRMNKLLVESNRKST